MFCSPSQTGLFRAANSIFAKVGRLASEEVIVQLLKQKCLPILLYGLDVYHSKGASDSALMLTLCPLQMLVLLLLLLLCNLDKRSMHSLDFAVNRFFLDPFNMEIAKCCQSVFWCELPSVLLTQRYDKFIDTVTNLS